MTSAWVNGTSAIHGSRSTPFASSHFGSRPSSPESDQDTEVKWERDSTLTDHEYQDLDIVLEEADGEMDRITSKRLWEGVAAPATKRRKSELFKDETAVYKGKFSVCSLARTLTVRIPRYGGGYDGKTPLETSYEGTLKAV